MKRIGVIEAIGKMELAYISEDILDDYLKDDRYFSINIDDEYYIFVRDTVDINSELYSITLTHLNQELMILTQMDKDKIKKVGRPKIVLDTNMENILHDYFQCKIGTSEAKERIGITQRNNSTWQRLQKEYKDKYSIIAFKNNIDNFRSNPKVDETEERVIGYITLKGDIKYRFYTSGLVEEYNK